MPKRNDKIAKERRRQRAQDRATQIKQFHKHMENMTLDQRLIVAIFGGHETCSECQAEKLVGADCMTPHCKELREETSLFYDSVTEDHITVRGATMVKGVDY